MNLKSSGDTTKESEPRVAEPEQESAKLEALRLPEKRQKRGGKNTKRPPKCTVNGCNRKCMAKGLCTTHYARLRLRGDVQPEIPISFGRRGYENTKFTGMEKIRCGRVYVYSPNHPVVLARNASTPPYILRYRLVMENHLGRYLLKSEHVHHKNGNPMDDRIENLELLSGSEHMKLHHPKLNRWSIKYLACTDCGLTTSPHHGNGMCRKCYSANQNEKRNRH